MNTQSGAGANSAQNAAQSAQVVIVKQKSALVGFLLAFVGLGWFGIDRFYKGDIKIGLFKLFCPILALLVLALGGLSQAFIVASAIIAVIGCFFWLLDWILVPLGISRDNAKRLAIAQGISGETFEASQKTEIQEDYVFMIMFLVLLFIIAVGWLFRNYL